MWAEMGRFGWGTTPIFNRPASEAVEVAQFRTSDGGQQLAAGFLAPHTIENTNEKAAEGPGTGN